MLYEYLSCDVFLKDICLFIFLILINRIVYLTMQSMRLVGHNRILINNAFFNFIHVFNFN